MASVLVLNGWAASERAWELCRFPRERIFSYREHLAGETEHAVATGGERILVGWSMGGTFALMLALRYPEKIKGMVLLAGTPRMMADGPDWPGFTPHKLAAFKKGLDYSLNHGPMGLDAGLPNPYARDAEVNLDAGLKFLSEVDIRAELTAAPPAMPVRIFHSERDAVVKLNASRFLVQTLPHSTLEVIPGSEHALPVIIPAKIDAAVRF